MTHMFHPDEGTDELGDNYGQWLIENGFEGDEPADELLMFNADLTAEQRDWLTRFCAAFREAEAREDVRLADAEWF